MVLQTYFQLVLHFDDTADVISTSPPLFDGTADVLSTSPPLFDGTADVISTGSPFQNCHSGILYCL